MEPDATVVEVLRTLLPLGTAVVGFLGGLATIPVSERVRRRSTIIERRRSDMAGLLHVIAESVNLPRNGRHGPEWSNFVVQITEAEFKLQLDMAPREAESFHAWFDKKCVDLYRLGDNRATDDGFRSYAGALNRLASDLMKFHRGELSAASLNSTISD